MTISIGLVGVRGFGEKRARSFLKNPKAVLSRCFHPDKLVCEEAAKNLGCKPSRSFEEILEDLNVEAVVISTPTPLHFEQIQAAIRSGKHVFVEKPMVLRLQEGLALQKDLANFQKVFMVGHNYRRKKGIRLLKKMLASGQLGSPVSFEIHFSHGGGFNFQPNQWRWNASLCPGGPLSMLGTHAFDVLEYLGGSVKTVQSRVHKLYAATEAEDTTSHLIEMNSGATASVANHYIVPSFSRVWVAGTEGIAWWDGFENRVYYRIGRDIDRKPSPLHSQEVEEDDLLTGESDEFLRCIAEGQKPETGYSEGLRAVAFVHAALEANRNSKKIFFEDYLKAEGSCR